MSKHKKAFTLIELLVVIAIIGILATISVLALSNARAKSRDAKRAGDMKQIQTALELFFNDNNRYPTAEEWNTGKIYSTSTGVTSTYMQIIPTAPTPADGTCSSGQNTVSYTPTSDGSSYSISFCLGNTTGTLTPGPKCLTPGGIVDVDCSIGGSAPSTVFAVSVGDTGMQYANAVQLTSDGGYIVAGPTDANNYDMYIAKLTSSGSMDSSFGTNGVVTVGGSGYQIASDIQTTSDGGYVVVGYADTDGGDAYIVKLTSNGSLDNAFGTNGSVMVGGAGSQNVFSVQQTSDGGYILAGQTDANSYDAYIVKLTSSGSLDNSFGTNGVAIIGDASMQYAFSIQQTPDGGYIFVGPSGENNGDIYMAKLTSSGSLDSGFGVSGIVLIGGAGQQYSYSLDRTTDGGYVLAGGNYASNSGDIYIVKLTSDGSIDNTFGANGVVNVGGAGEQYATHIEQTTDGGYIVLGDTDANNYDWYVAKINANGSMDTDFGVGGVVQIGDNNYQESHSIKETSDGGFIAAGRIDTNVDDVYLVKMDSQGNY